MKLITNDYNILKLEYFKLNNWQESHSVEGIDSELHNMICDLETKIIRSPIIAESEVIHCYKHCKAINSKIKTRITELEKELKTISTPDSSASAIFDMFCDLENICGEKKIKVFGKESELIASSDNSEVQKLAAKRLLYFKFVQMSFGEAILGIWELIRNYYPNMEIIELTEKSDSFYILKEKKKSGITKKKTYREPLEFADLFNEPYDTYEELRILQDRFDDFLTEEVRMEHPIPLRVYTDLFDFLRKKDIVKHIEGVRRTQMLITFYAGFGKKISTSKADAADVYTVTRNVIREINKSKFETQFEKLLRGLKK